MKKTTKLNSKKLLNAVASINTLFWRYNRKDKTTELLNNCEIYSLKNRLEKMFNNLIYAETIVDETDFFRFKMFVAAMRNGEPAMAIFRIPDLHGYILWLRIEGSPDKDSPEYYNGCIQDISREASVITLINNKETKKKNISKFPGYEKTDEERSLKNDKIEINNTFSDQLQEETKNVNDIMKLLNTFLGNQPGKKKFDNIIYSDTYIKKNKIQVYTAGPSYNSHKIGKAYSYEGTVSEHIVKKNLPHLIVNNTLSSTKPIDWMLFLPYGILSYIAIPFFERKTLRTLLIFCSNEANRFSEKDVDLYKMYVPAFLQGLKNWRKWKRRKR